MIRRGLRGGIRHERRKRKEDHAECFICGAILNPLTARALLLAGLIGVFQYAMAFWLYLYGLRRVPASRAAKGSKPTGPTARWCW